MRAVAVGGACALSCLAHGVLPYRPRGLKNREVLIRKDF